MLNERRSLPTKDSSRDAGIKAAQPEPAKAAPTKVVNRGPTPLMPSHVSQRRQQGHCQGHPDEAPRRAKVMNSCTSFFATDDLAGT